MSIAKIEVSLGSFKFSGDGEQKWLSEQLDKVLKEFPKLQNIVVKEKTPTDDLETTKKSISSVGSLAKLIKDNHADKNPGLKFLGAAVYIAIKEKNEMKIND